MGGLRPHRGITVIPTCGAAPAPVMPQVRRTWGRAESRENPQVRPSPALHPSSPSEGPQARSRVKARRRFVGRLGGGKSDAGASGNCLYMHNHVCTVAPATCMYVHDKRSRCE